MNACSFSWANTQEWNISHKEKLHRLDITGICQTGDRGDGSVGKGLWVQS